jgi:hypothetical protein
MNKKRLMIVVAMVLLLLTTVAAVSANDGSDLAQVRAATALFHRTEVAQAEGWDLIPGLDHCFDNQPTGAMGFHYINGGKIDATVEVLQPEAMVYAPGPNGQLMLGAVEYIVDAPSWDAANPGVLPNVLGQDYHAHPVLPIYVLHAWIWKNNPSGMFQDWNPNVTCP